VNRIADVVRAARASGNVAVLADAIPYLQFLGVKVEHVGGQLLGKMHYADHLIGATHLPALHGGTIGALLESTATLQALWEGETEVLPKIVTITIDFLRSGRPVDTFARGTITKQGRRVVIVSVDAWQEDATRPIARGKAVFLVEPLKD
jgi:acyl-coenzyme A thioesterase PaaI-like protein